MFSSPFFRRLFLSYLLLIVAISAAIGLYAAACLRQSYIERTCLALRDTNHALEQAIAGPLAAGDPAGALADMISRLARQIDCRITLIESDGKVIADTEARAATMDNHRQRPEVIAAAATGEGWEIRRSDTLKRDMLYLARSIAVAAPADSGPGHKYFLRVAMHLSDLNRDVYDLYEGMAFMTIAALILAAGGSFYFARRQAEPLVHITRFAEALSRGEVEHRRIPRRSAGNEEITLLTAALNSMAESIQRLLARGKEENAQIMTILASMSEGVIATDRQQRILMVNRAAATLLGFAADAATGKFLWEVVRNDDVIKGAADSLAVAGSKTFVIGPINARHLEITICTFPLQKNAEGMVIVAHDTTQSVQYQDLRKEFVANVSHELRTPLSIIKGFAETLRDGALADPQRGPQYLATIEKHTDQLTNLVDDLLELSRLESQYGLTRRVPTDLSPLIRRACDLLLPVAQRKQQQFIQEIPPSLPPILAAADYIERAIANLIDNAIKYTPAKGIIKISAKEEGKFLVVEVSDNGIGISDKDLPRIFERFYRVDKSRSREAGGTGLGLSIVKHVAQVHGGTVDVASTSGQGSTFRLILPLKLAVISQ